MSISALTHSFDFDPSYGMDLQALLQVTAPPAPGDFAEFWRVRYQRVLQIAALPSLEDTGQIEQGWRVFELQYRSTDAVLIGGWLLVPEQGPVRRGLIVGHGYGGRDAPDFDLPVVEAALLFPCFRGLGRSQQQPYAADPSLHVLHHIEDRDRYILGGCVDDLWLGVSALLAIYPQLAGHVGYMGISFGGGIGALALPWEPRIQRAHFNVPSFGHQRLRLELPTTGSAHAVQQFAKTHRHIAATLAYYDAAIAAGFIEVPIHIAAALFDPVVAPPGQFAIYNALLGPKRLFVLEAGHIDYPNQQTQEDQLRLELKTFFAAL